MIFIWKRVFFWKVYAFLLSCNSMNIEQSVVLKSSFKIKSCKISAVVKSVKIFFFRFKKNVRFFPFPNTASVSIQLRKFALLKVFSYVIFNIYFKTIKWIFLKMVFFEFTGIIGKLLNSISDSFEYQLGTPETMKGWVNLAQAWTRWYCKCLYQILKPIGYVIA